MTVSHRPTVLAIVLAPLLAVPPLLAPATAQARDFCFNSSVFAPVILVVAQNFKVPRRGKCKPIVGFDVGYFGFAAARPASGTACLNTAGDTLQVGITIHAVNDAIDDDEEIQLHMRIPYPALTGGTTYLRQSDPYLLSLRGEGSAGDCGYTIAIP